MYRVTLRLLCTPLFLLLICSAQAWAGQMGGHIYSALLAKQYLSGSARRAVDAHLDLYLSGAQGPDICGVVMPELNTVSFFTAIGGETHYSEKKALLALNLLDCATTDGERAYALGWITHYINDMFVHETVNNYGGYYKEFGAHHKELEMLEQKHVLARHADLVTPGRSTTIPTTGGKADFANFIFDAYHRTYPDNPIYQSGNEWFVENKPYFSKRYIEASDLCRVANGAFLRSHTDGTGKHGWAIGGTAVFPAMPDKAAYARMTRAIEITSVEAAADRLRVTVAVHDTKLYGRFLVDWEAAITDATRYANQVFTLASAYLDENEPGKKAGLRKELLAVIPNVNLDQPRANFSSATVTPGNVDAKQVSYLLTLYPQTTSGAPLPKPVLLEGRSPVANFPTKHFAGSCEGTLTFDITLPAKASPYHFTLQVMLSGKDALKCPEYRDVDWVEVQGQHPGTWMSGAGGVKVTDLFTVRVPIPETVDTARGARRWVVMAPSHSLAAEDLAIIRASLPHEQYRYDVQAIEERIEGDTLVATLQVTDTYADRQVVKGPAKLMLVWFTEGKAHNTTDEVLGELKTDLDQSLADLERVEEIMDNLLTDEQEEKLGKIMEQYEASLVKQGKSEEEIERLMEARAFAEMEKMGVDMSVFDELNAITQKANDAMALPFHITSDVTLVPVSLSMDVTAGWKRGDHATAACAETRKDDKGRLMWSMDGHVSAFMSDDEDAMAKFQKAHAGHASAVPVTVQGFSGMLYEERTPVKSDGGKCEYAYSAEGYLAKGKAYIRIYLSGSASGYKIFEQDEDKKLQLVYDGSDDAKTAIERIISEGTAMLRGLRLQPAQ